MEIIPGLQEKRESSFAGDWLEREQLFLWKRRIPKADTHVNLLAWVSQILWESWIISERTWILLPTGMAKLFQEWCKDVVGVKCKKSYIHHKEKSWGGHIKAHSAMKSTLQLQREGTQALALLQHGSRMVERQSRASTKGKTTASCIFLPHQRAARNSSVWNSAGWRKTSPKGGRTRGKKPQQILK